MKKFSKSEKKNFVPKKKIFFLFQITWNIEKNQFWEGSKFEEGGGLWGGLVKIAKKICTKKIFFFCSKSSETWKKSIFLGGSKLEKGGGL